MFMTILESVIGVCAVVAALTVSISTLLRFWQERRMRKNYR